MQWKHYDCTNPVPNEYLSRSMRCRRCPACLRLRSRQWYMRNWWEIENCHLLGGRSWFVTLTFRSVPSDTYQEVQAWLKRFRKSSRAVARYVAVLEAGTLSGRLHQHLIVCAGASLTQRQMRTKWQSGISEAKLIPPSSTRAVSRYISGYVAKGATTIHASVRWGNPPGEAYLLPSKCRKAPKIKIPF